MTNQEVTSVARALVESVIVRYGVPLQTLTDQGTIFDGKLFREVYRLLNIYDLIQRFHKTLEVMLGKTVAKMLAPSPHAAESGVF